MAQLSITNNTVYASQISDPDNGVDYIKLPPSTTTVKTVTANFIDAVGSQLDELLSRFEDDGSPSFIVDVSLGDTLSPSSLQGSQASADITQWIGNHVGYGLLVAAPTTPSVVAAWRVNHAVGEAYVDGKHFVVALAADETGDGDYAADGTAFAGPLTAAKDRYASFVLVNNAGTLEKIFVFGAEADAGDAVPVTQLEIATAVAAHLSEDDPNYSFVELASILFEESSGLTQTNTSVRAVPPSY